MTSPKSTESGPAEPDLDPAHAAQDWRVDPIGRPAEAAGFIDHELWWEQQVEQRIDANELFRAIQEGAPVALPRAEHPETRRRDPVREAYMRLRLRRARGR